MDEPECLRCGYLLREKIAQQAVLTLPCLLELSQACAVDGGGIEYDRVSD